MSLLGALTPLGKVARKLWFRSVLAYTIAGSVSAILLGVILGTVGYHFIGKPTGGATLYLISFLSLALASKEFGWISFDLPERKLQTEKTWVHEFGFVMASAMWGLHIGLGFATRITHGGFWILVSIALMLGDPLYSTALMLAYWLGRALPVWVAPTMLKSGSVELAEMIPLQGPFYHRIVGFALLWLAVVTLLFALRPYVP